MDYYEAVIGIMQARPYMSVAQAKEAANELFSDGPKECKANDWRFRFHDRGMPWIVSGPEECIDALVHRFKVAGLEP